MKPTDFENQLLFHLNTFSIEKVNFVPQIESQEK